MRKPTTVYVLSEEDYDRLAMMLASLAGAVETLFDRRLVEPSACPDDTGDFDAVADRVRRLDITF